VPCPCACVCLSERNGSGNGDVCACAKVLMRRCEISPLPIRLNSTLLDSRYISAHPGVPAKPQILFLITRPSTLTTHPLFARRTMDSPVSKSRMEKKIKKTNKKKEHLSRRLLLHGGTQRIRLFHSSQILDQSNMKHKKIYGKKEEIQIERFH